MNEGLQVQIRARHLVVSPVPTTRAVLKPEATAAVQAAPRGTKRLGRTGARTLRASARAARWTAPSLRAQGCAPRGAVGPRFVSGALALRRPWGWGCEGGWALGFAVVRFPDTYRTC